MTSENKAITRIKVEGYRSLKSVDLALGRVTVLIGANGSGKSNLLSLLRMITLMRTQSLRRFSGEAGGASALLHYGPKVTKEISLRLEFEQQTGANADGARLGYAAGDTLLFLDETIEYRPVGGAVSKTQSLGAGHAESKLEDSAADPGNKAAKAVRWWLSKTNFFHFHDTSSVSPLRQNSRQEDVRFLRSDGSNLAAYLRSLETSDEPARQAAWRRINQLVRRVAPFIKSLQPTLVAPSHPETSAVRLDWVDERDQLFGPHQLSDGTLRCIALFTALGQPVEALPAFLSIDEPELGLHPVALAILASLIRSVWERRVLGEHTGAAVSFTTLFDLYGLPDDFPQLAVLSQNADTLKRVAELEQAMFAAVNDHRLIPYIQRHEFEALVLASLDSLGALLDAKDDVEGLSQLRADLANQAPEDINDGHDTAPSKRLKGRIPGYVKTLHGPLAVESTGLMSIRAVCPRFDAWVTKLEGLSVRSAS